MKQVRLKSSFTFPFSLYWILSSVFFLSFFLSFFRAPYQRKEKKKKKKKKVRNKKVRRKEERKERKERKEKKRKEKKRKEKKKQTNTNTNCCRAFDGETDLLVVGYLGSMGMCSGEIQRGSGAK